MADDKKDSDKPQCGIIAAIMLGIGRVIGETMAL